MVKQESKCINQLFIEGKNARVNKYFEEAKNIYETIIQNDPNCVEAFNNLGVTLCELGRYRRALEAYLRINENFRTAQTWYNISLVYYYLRDFDQALNCIQKAIEHDCYDSAAWDLKGKIQVEQEDYQGAMTSFNQAFSTDGEPQFLLWDAYCLYLQLEFSKDIDERTQRKLLHILIRRLERLKEISEDYHERNISKDKNLMSREEDSATQIGGSTPQNSSKSNSDCEICQQSLYYLGCSYSRYKDYSTAIDKLEQCIQKDPGSMVAKSARKLLKQSWIQIKPSPLKWWLQSSLYLNRRMKKFVAIFTLTMLILIVIFILFHPLFVWKNRVEWSVYIFVASLLLILLLSPGVEQIKAKDIEIKMHASPPFNPFPSPAKMEDDIGSMSRKNNETN
ncbi:tetratricopeptide repeat protein [Acaryochloris sp. IP29b_bin.137]|uniref:tetratricopeptide repeat protein n=1 Tax=Acaryochloris sp. IP29b_bin.137 TaxID=2969217 RepID=UPI00261D4B99|nr:tetratricopeptide repeat protein [Acaryochloris sp. IP29b_bin.137]